MKVRIAKVGEALFEGEARSLSVPGSEGDMTILPHHVPLATALREGTVVVRTDTEELTFPIARGVLEVSSNEAIVLL